MEKILIKRENIDLIAYDFDGVMTDNNVLVLDDGREAVFCNRADGLAVRMIKELGIEQVILSTEISKVVRLRAKKLGIKAINAVSDKKSVLLLYCKKRKHSLKKVIYLGNDLNDLEAMKIVGMPVCPSDASGEIREVSKLVLKARGGQGVVRNLLAHII